MKIIKYISFSMLLAVGVLISGCEEPLDPYPLFETVPHGLGRIKAGTPTSFLFGKNDSKIEGDLLWISTDKKVTVNKMELKVTWSEGYLDKDRLPKTAVHGTKVIKALASAGKAREAQNWVITAAEVYEAFKAAKFDYDDGKGVVDVFARPKDIDRSLTKYFTSNDKFIITWKFTSEDGRVFESWSQGICNETVGSNCALNFGVVCESNLAGTYAFESEGTTTDPTPSITPKFKTLTGTVTLKALGSGRYEISDYSGGLYGFWYAAAYGVNNTTHVIGVFTDACERISGNFEDAGPGFDGNIVITGRVIDAAKGIIEYTWLQTEYGDVGKMKLTKR